jgi:hypothetical protein
LIPASNSVILNAQSKIDIITNIIQNGPSVADEQRPISLYPRSEQEAAEVQEIIRLLKFHQAPEVLNSNLAGGIGGFFLVPPSEFDIQFYYNGRENPNIPKISTCALTNMAVDYSPTGFAAYETLNSIPTLGGTGMPVAIRLTLQFAELEILTKSNFEKPKDNPQSRTNTNSNAPQ